MKFTIQSSFAAVINDTILNLQKEFSQIIHSIYLYGSVAAGNAIVGHSDLDLTIIFKRKLTTKETNQLEKTKIQLEQQHFEVTKIDFDIGIIAEIIKDDNKPVWSYWIKNFCKFIYGIDLNNYFSDIPLSKEIIKAINGDYRHYLSEDIIRITKTEPHNQKEILQIKKEIAKRLIRSTALLWQDYNQYLWPTSLEKLTKIVKLKYPAMSVNCHYLLSQTKKPDLEINLFLKTAIIFCNWLTLEENKNIDNNKLEL